MICFHSSTSVLCLCFFKIANCELRRSLTHMNSLSLYCRAEGASHYSVTGCPVTVPPPLLSYWAMAAFGQCRDRTIAFLIRKPAYKNPNHAAFQSNAGAQWIHRKIMKVLRLALCAMRLASVFKCRRQGRSYNPADLSQGLGVNLH